MLPVSQFNSETIKRLLKGAARIAPTLSTKPGLVRLPILREMVEKIVTNGQSDDIEAANLDAAFTLLYAGFLRLGEVSYSAQDHTQKAFAATHTTRDDVKFFDGFMRVHLKRSKTDYDHTGTTITIAEMQGTLCPVAAMKRLFAKDPQLSHNLNQRRPRQKFYFIIRQRTFECKTYPNWDYINRLHLP